MPLAKAPSLRQVARTDGPPSITDDTPSSQDYLEALCGSLSNPDIIGGRLSYDDIFNCADCVKRTRVFPILIATIFYHLRCCVDDQHFFQDFLDKTDQWMSLSDVELLTKSSEVHDDIRSLFTESQLVSPECGCSVSVSRDAKESTYQLDFTITTDALASILGSRTVRRELLALKGSAAQTTIDGLHTLLSAPCSEPSAVTRSRYRAEIQRILYKLCRNTGLHPRALDLRGVYVNQDAIVGSGGFSDVYKGRFRGTDVAVKRVRLVQNSASRNMQEFASELIIWSQLRHPNLLPPHGAFHVDRGPCLVSPWMENGNIRTYCTMHPDARVGPLMLDIASGLNSLHTQEPIIIHGDLKPDNVLVNSSGRAVISDFGLSKIGGPSLVERTTKSYTQSIARGGTYRYQAPELLKGETSATPESDVYALGCIFYELYSHCVPYEGRHEAATICAISRGERLKRPPEMGIDMWNLTSACLSYEPADRPSVSEVLEVLTSIIEDTRPPPADQSDLVVPHEHKQPESYDGDMCSSPEVWTAKTKSCEHRVSSTKKSPITLRFEILENGSINITIRDLHVSLLLREWLAFFSKPGQYCMDQQASTLAADSGLLADLCNIPSGSRFSLLL